MNINVTTSYSMHTIVATHYFKLLRQNPSFESNKQLKFPIQTNIWSKRKMNNDVFFKEQTYSKLCRLFSFSFHQMFNFDILLITIHYKVHFDVVSISTLNKVVIKCKSIYLQFFVIQFYTIPSLFWNKKFFAEM